MIDQAVGGDVVYHGDQYVLGVGGTEECCVEWDFDCQVERVARRRADGLIQPARRPPRGINNLPTELGPLDRDDDLLRYSIGRCEQRAQAFVAVDHIGQRRTQRFGVDSPAQPQRHGHVVDRRWSVQLVEEPQSALCERQRNHCWSLTGYQGLEPSRIPADPGRQLRDRGSLEHGAHRKIGVQAGVDGADQAHRRQRIAAQIEKRVVNPDPLQPQHLGVDVGQDLLDGAGRRAVTVALLVLRCRKCLAVQLA